ncbi:hypothetical protein PMAYCL1PPCAC_08691, partial [Pristionchus mayeri]
DHSRPYCVEGRVRMVRKHRNPVEASLERRIARAYHDYGSSRRAFRSTYIGPASPSQTTAPEWFFRTPTMYVQQIVVHSNVRPWTPYNLSAENVVRGALSLAFPLRETLLEHLNDT